MYCNTWFYIVEFYNDLHKNGIQEVGIERAVEFHPKAFSAHEAKTKKTTGNVCML